MSRKPDLSYMSREGEGERKSSKIREGRWAKRIIQSGVNSPTKNYCQVVGINKYLLCYMLCT